MRYSQLFGQSTRNVTKEVKSKGLEYLLRGGFLRESSSGRFYMLPLGMLLQEKICSVVEKEMNSLGAQRILAPNLHPRELWEETRRTESASFELMQVEDRSARHFVLGGTAEEMLVALVRQFAISYKDLPFCLYQFSTKFRDELRARGGLLRAREFLMKDAYSFHANREDFEEYYSKISASYTRIFEKLGLTARRVAADNGIMGGDYCHEYIVDHELGESRYFIDQDDGSAIHEDIFKVEDRKEGRYRECRGIEVGNIFQLGTWYSERMQAAQFTAADDAKHPYFMGCYGIGIGRTLATIAEIFHDEQGLKWPASCSPYDFQLIVLGKEEHVLREAEAIYQTLLNAGKTVLFDDREVSAGVKFADADLIGVSQRIVVSERLLRDNKIELSERATGQRKEIERAAFLF